MTKTEKFKIGDRVVRVAPFSNGTTVDVEVGDAGVIESFSSKCANVQFDRSSKLYNDLNKIELEHVFHSPLYQALM